ncbi:transglycosylase SLT domain-containing protein [Acetobacter indonesiensis]|uniref:transglycosylase SLT domain-containing protein n=1 Tax=Acetobacter indonesiensis TaxID=104101 RepID=UPI0039E8D400
MATVIDALIVQLGLDAKAVVKGQKQAEGAFKRVQSGASKMGDGVAAAADTAGDAFHSLERKALAFFAVLTAGKTLKAFISDTTSANVAAGNMARNLGVSVNSLTAWQKAAQAAGGSAEDVSGSIGSLVSQFQTIDGRRNLGNVFGQMGVQLEGANGQIRDMNDLMPDLARAAQRLGPQMFSALGSQAGFSQGFINLLEQGPDHIQKLYKSLQKYAPTERDTKASAQLLEDWTKLTAQSEAFGRSIMTDLSPEVHELMTMLSQGIDSRAPSGLQKIHDMGDDLYKRFKEINWEKVGAEIKAWEETLKQIDLKEVIKDVTALGQGANNVAQFLGGWKNAAELLLTLWISGKAMRAIANVARFAEVSIAGATAMSRILKGAGIEEVAKPAETAAAKEAAKKGAETAGGVIAGKTAGKFAKVGKIAGRGLMAGNLAADGYLFMQYFPHVAAWLTGQGWNDEHPTTFRGNARGLGQRLTPDMKAKQAFLGRLEKQYGLPNGLLDGMWAQESSRGLNAVPSKAGALGDFQIMPDVAAAAGVDPHNFEQAAEYAAKRMQSDMQHYQGSLASSLAEYNWGGGNLKKAQQAFGQGWQSHVPQETLDYITSVSRAVDAASQKASMGDENHTVNNTFGDTHLNVTTNASDPHAVAKAVKTTFDRNQRMLARQANLGLS